MKHSFGIFRCARLMPGPNQCKPTVYQSYQSWYTKTIFGAVINDGIVLCMMRKYPHLRDFSQVSQGEREREREVQTFYPTDTYNLHVHMCMCTVCILMWAFCARMEFFFFLLDTFMLSVSTTFPPRPRECFYPHGVQYSSEWFKALGEPSGACLRERPLNVSCEVTCTSRLQEESGDVRGAGKCVLLKSHGYFPVLNGAPMLQLEWSY